MDIRATISSPTPVAQAYLIGVGRISTVEDGLQDVVFFQEIGHLGPEPKQVRVLKSGLSPGFELQKVDLHVYREGQELVSDLSAKQIAFTHEQVIEYLVLDHRASHPGETLPAQPVWSLAPSALLAAENARLFDYPLTVEIDARGRGALGGFQSHRARRRGGDRPGIALPAGLAGRRGRGQAPPSSNLRDFFR